MATAAAPAAIARPAGHAATVVRLDRPAVRYFGSRPPVELAPCEIAFMAGLLAEFDLPADSAQHARGDGNSFVQMGAELFEALDRPLPPLDVLVLAYHLPDLTAADVNACALVDLCDGETAGFSIADQGVGAPFTALRILRGLRVTGALAGAGAVLVLDQSTSLYHDPDTHDVPITDCAVLLRTDPRDGDGAVLDFLDESPVNDPDDGFRELLRAHPEADVVVGRMLAEHLGDSLHAAAVAAAGPRRLCTDVWAALAGRWPLGGPTVVADYDPHNGRLFSAGLRPERPI